MTSLLAPFAAAAPSTFWTDTVANLTAVGWRLIIAVIIIVGAVLVSWLLRVVIRRVVARIVSGVKNSQNVDETQALLASPLASVRVVQRTRTLGTVLSNIVNVLVAIIALILVVNQIFPDVLTSFALISAAIGAGLGFGAQNIVKDVLNGLFMVMEDQLGVGDVVDLGPATGMVEAVGIRVTQIRDVNGTLWFVRNGEILRVGNMSQGWARVIIDLAVPYDADVDAVQEAILKTAQELAASPKWRARIMERPELWGLESVSADAVVLRVVVKTRTSAKDDVARELRLRLKKTLDEMNIALPSLSSVVLAGFDGAGSIAGARPPRTRPLPVVTTQLPAKGRGRKAKAAKQASQSATQTQTQPRPTQTPRQTPTPQEPSTTTSRADPRAIRRPPSPPDGDETNEPENP